MNLYFLRHAKAGPHRRRYKPDSKRPLTSGGEKQARKVSAGLEELDLKLDVILSSPYLRAFQTAQIASEVLGVTLHTTDTLGAEASPAQFIQHVHEKYSTLENILLVGHEPYMSHLMAVLWTGHGDAQIDFKKAGAAKLSIIKELQYGRCACLHWLMTPKQLSKLGK